MVKKAAGFLRVSRRMHVLRTEGIASLSALTLHCSPDNICYPFGIKNNGSYDYLKAAEEDDKLLWILRRVNKWGNSPIG